MACEKYSGWMTAASLGALPAADEAELRAHTAACARCRAEWEAIESLVAAMDRSVQSMVAGEPSPQFAARLRARLAEEPAPSAWPMLTWPRIAVAALAAAAAVLLAVLVMRAPERTHESLPIAVNPPAQISPVSPEKVAVTPRRTVAGNAAAPNHAIVRRHSEMASLDMEVLVPRGQVSAALALSEAVNAGLIDGQQLSALEEKSAEPLAVQALLISPLKTSPLRAADESTSGDGGRR